MNKIVIPFSEINFTYSRSSGAGGQNVNKVNSKVTMTWTPAADFPSGVLERFRARYPQYVLDDGTIHMVCQNHRSQKANIDECVARLHELINSVLRPPKIRKATKPTRSSIQKRLSGKRKDAEKKQSRKKNYE